MLKGPRGEKRPADVVGCAVMVAKIATGEIDESVRTSGRTRSGRAGAAARKKALSPERRREIAKKAATARWNRELNQ